MITSLHRISGRGPRSDPMTMLSGIWAYRHLIARLARREIEARYRGSALGMLWALLLPLLMLATYLFVFSFVFRPRWAEESGTTGEYALYLFSGLIIYTIFADNVNRAPGLMLENVSYIKKVMFPLEILPCMLLVAAISNAVVSFAILIVAYVAVLGLPPPTILLLPLAVLPLLLLTLGISWFLASVGVYLRDIRQIVGVATTALMFLSPIFYPAAALPQPIRGLLYLNPLTPILEESRSVLFAGRIGDVGAWFLCLAAGSCVAWLGYVWFVKSRKGFADVV